MSLNRISISSKLRNYSAILEKITPQHVEKKVGENAFFIIDENVWDLYKSSIFKSLSGDNKYILKIGENEKRLESVMMILDQLVQKNIKKNLKIIAVGGGITQDISGHLASILYRGIKWDFWATTLLSQADSCIGGKTSLNYKNFKNLIGTFYPPDEIIIDVAFNRTLKEYDYLSGIGEIAKLHIIGGPLAADSFISMSDGLLKRKDGSLRKAILDSLNIKKDYIEDDEFDSGRRNYLNYGHCFGHAIETATDFTIPHGLAVVMGMVLANHVSFKRGLLSGEKLNYFNSIICLPILSSLDLKNINISDESIINGMKQDKKRTGSGLPLVMIDNEFKMSKVDDLSEVEVSEVMRELR